METSITVPDRKKEEIIELSIIQSIHEIRGIRVILDFDLAKRYGVETRALKQAVRRNIERFPLDFMFQLTKQEWSELITICDKFNGNIKHSPITPYAFTQEGVAMLSGVLHSKKAIDANIKIMRAFVAFREYALNYTELEQKIEKLTARLDDTNAKTDEIFLLLKELFEQKKAFENRPRIGFKTMANPE
jgi:uncharacterized protein with ACT and thioredoxin-like domain